MWPLDPNALEASLLDFLTRKLQFSALEVGAMGKFQFERCSTRSKKIAGEYVVTFRNSEVRDMVRGAAKNLAGDSTSGMRLHIPGYLESNFKSLENISYALKQKHQSMKRNIKYDDENRDLRLDFQIGPDDGWRTILPDQARRFNRVPRSGNSTRRTMTVDDISTLMSDIPMVL